jgi:hypothetical protein
MLPHFPGLVDRLLYLHSPMGWATRASMCLWTHRPTALTLPPVGWAPMPPGIPDPWTGSSAFVSLRGADFHAATCRWTHGPTPLTLSPSGWAPVPPHVPALWSCATPVLPVTCLCHLVRKLAASISYVPTSFG